MPYTEPNVANQQRNEIAMALMNIGQPQPQTQMPQPPQIPQMPPPQGAPVGQPPPQGAPMGGLGAPPMGQPPMGPVAQAPGGQAMPPQAPNPQMPQQPPQGF